MARMLGLRIWFILTVFFSILIFFVGENLAVEKPNQPFLVQPKASFSPNNFVTSPAPASTLAPTAPTPQPQPQSSAQLRSFREALAVSSPISIPAQIQPQTQQQIPHQSQQQFTRQIQTANYHEAQGYKYPIQQVAATEQSQPLPLPSPVTTKESREGEPAEDKINKIQKQSTTPQKNFSEEKINGEPIDSGELDQFSGSGDLSDGSSDDLLDKPLDVTNAKEGKGKLKQPQLTNAIVPLASVLGSLLIVVSAFLIFVLFLKKVSPKNSRQIPREAFENLGRVMLTQKIQLQLLRLGNRLILVSVTPDGVSPVTEITDPDEVVPLLGMCRQLDPNSSTEFFRKTINGGSSGKTEGGYFDTDVKRPSKTKTKIDFYSEPDESLAEILAKGGHHG
jgi:flagellar biogenesis protein FliO